LSSTSPAYFLDHLPIYDTGIGNIQDYVDNKIVIEVPKQDNYRCSKKVIEFINKIRKDGIKQKPSLKDANDNILNNEGSVSFLYSSQTAFDLDGIKNQDIFANWDFEDPQKTKILFLTHKLIAKRYGFENILEAYSNYRYTDNLTGNEPDILALHLLKIAGVLYNFKNKNYNFIIREIQYKITNHQKKVELSKILTGFSICLDMTIGQMITEFDSMGIIKLDDRFNEFIENHPDLFAAVKSLSTSQLTAYYEYYNDLSPYSTQHGVKGAEFDNVLVILDNGDWNKYNFQHYFENTGKESIIERTNRLFYVCCSRAKDNLVVYVDKPSLNFVNCAKSLFGEENVHEI
jgi:DNA helicase-2/ATP-dependent DNA helicase PcrA